MAANENATAPGALGHDEIVALMREWDAAWAARDAERMASMFTDDAVWEDPSLTRSIEGRPALKRYFDNMLRAIPDIAVRQERIFADPENAACATQWRITGTMSGRIEEFGTAPTGDSVEFTGMAFGTIRDGKMHHVRQYVDVLNLQRQIGAMPPQGSRGEKLLMRLQALGAKRRMKKNSR